MTESIDNVGSFDKYPTFSQYERAPEVAGIPLTGYAALRPILPTGRQSYRDAEELHRRSIWAAEIQRRALMGNNYDAVMRQASSIGNVGGIPFGAVAANLGMDYVASPNSFVNQMSGRYLGGNQSLAAMQIYSGYTGLTNASIGRVGNIDAHEVQGVLRALNSQSYMPRTGVYDNSFRGSSSTDITNMRQQLSEEAIKLSSSDQLTMKQGMANMPKEEFTRIVDSLAEKMGDEEGKKFKEASIKADESKQSMVTFLNNYSDKLNTIAEDRRYTEGRSSRINYANTKGFNVEDIGRSAIVAADLNLMGRARGPYALQDQTTAYQSNFKNWISEAHQVFGGKDAAEDMRAVSDLLGKNSTIDFSSSKDTKALGKLLGDIKAAAEVAGITVDSILGIINEGKALVAAHPGLQGIGGAVVAKMALRATTAALNVNFGSTAEESRAMGGARGMAASGLEGQLIVQGDPRVQQTNALLLLAKNNGIGMTEIGKNVSATTVSGRLEQLRAFLSKRLPSDEAAKIGQVENSIYAQQDARTWAGAEVDEFSKDTLGKNFRENLSVSGKKGLDELIHRKKADPSYNVLANVSTVFTDPADLKFVDNPAFRPSLSSYINNQLPGNPDWQRLQDQRRDQDSLVNRMNNAITPGTWERLGQVGLGVSPIDLDRTWHGLTSSVIRNPGKAIGTTIAGLLNPIAGAAGSGLWLGANTYLKSDIDKKSSLSLGEAWRLAVYGETPEYQRAMAGTASWHGKDQDEIYDEMVSSPEQLAASQRLFGSTVNIGKHRTAADNAAAIKSAVGRTQGLTTAFSSSLEMSDRLDKLRVRKNSKAKGIIPLSAAEEKELAALEGAARLGVTSNEDQFKAIRDFGLTGDSATAAYKYGPGSQIYKKEEYTQNLAKLKDFEESELPKHLRAMLGDKDSLATYSKAVTAVNGGMSSADFDKLFKGDPNARLATKVRTDLLEFSGKNNGILKVRDKAEADNAGSPQDISHKLTQLTQAANTITSSINSVATSIGNLVA